MRAQVSSPAGSCLHTNAIESINARYQRAIKASGHFPNEAAAMKCFYLVTRSLDDSGRGRARWMMQWKPALNAFACASALLDMGIYPPSRCRDSHPAT
jgi:transposase-like protein